jgi:hypothetical protein
MQTSVVAATLVEYLPTAQSIQSANSSLPLVVRYVPAGQSVHAATFDAVLNLPSAHSVQVLAPVPVSVSVTDPAGQAAQAVVDAAVN